MVVGQRKWKETLRWIREATKSTDKETVETRATRKAKLEGQPEEWFKYYFPHYCTAEPALFQKEATERILNNPEYYEVRMWSRELAKSSRTMMEILYMMLVGHVMGDKPGRRLKRYVLLISNSLDNAMRLLMPFRANLEANARLIQDYGPQAGLEKWTEKEFITMRRAAFRALGAGQSPRGTRNEEVRPDVLIFDDIDTDADCLNPVVITNKWKWVEEAAMGTRSVSAPTTVLFCGNRIAVDCCIERAVAFADHVSEMSIRDKEGKSTWPAKNSEDHIDRVLRQKSYSAIQKEYYNNPIIDGAVFGEMHYKPALPPEQYECLVCYTDPSYKEASDYKATVLVGYKEGEYHILRSYVEQTTTAQMLKWHYEIMKMVGDCRCQYYMEDVFIQDVIRKEMNESSKRSGMKLHILGDKRQKQNKQTRIEALLEPLHREERLYLNSKERDRPGMVRLKEQFMAFAPGSNAHDDGPDAVEGAIWLINQKLQLAKSGAFAVSKIADKRRNRI